MRGLLLTLLFVSPLLAQERLDDLGEQLDAIKTKTGNVETIGLIFNPEDVAIEGARVNVKTIAIPATSGTVLIKNARSMVGRVEAIYLIKGRSVTTPKFAAFVVKLASKKNVMVYSNDSSLAGVEGVNLIAERDGRFVVN